MGRADIRAAIADYEASQSALQLELAKQYPDVHLNPGFQWDQGESKWQLGLTVDRRISFPLPRIAGKLFPYNEFVLIASKR